MPLTLEELFEVVNASTQFQQLAAFDQIWTDYLQHAMPPIPEQDVSILKRLTTGMTQLLEQAPEHARYLEYIVKSHSEDLEREYGHILETRQLPEEVATKVRDAVERRGGIVKFGQDGARGIVENAYAEREALIAKLDLIQSGGFSRGDLTPKFLCKLGAGIILAGFAVPFPTNVIAIGAGVAVIATVELTGGEC